MTDSAPPADASRTPARPRRRGRALALRLALAVALVAAVGGGAAWLWQTTAGLNAVASAASRLLPGRFEARNGSGAFASGFAFDEVLYESAELTVRIDKLRASLADLQLGLSLAALRFDFDALIAERVFVHVRPAAVPSTGVPASIASPVSVSARRLAVGAFELRTGVAPAPPQLQLRAIETRAAIGPAAYTVDAARFAFGPAKAPLQATLDARLDGARPFALDGRGTVSGPVGGTADGTAGGAAPGPLRERPLRATVVARGSLEDLRLEAEITPDAAAPAPAPDSTSMAPRGQVQARIATFETPVLRSLGADLQDIDPAAWVRGAPRARLALRAQLAPRDGPAFTLAGAVSVTNREPGPVDRDRVPVRSATAQVQASAASLRFTDVAAELVRGSARGRFETDLTQPAAWRAGTRFSGVDPATLHSRLRPFTLDGAADVVHEGGDTVVTGQVRNRAGLPLQATVDLRVDAARLRVNTAQLTLGRGQAMVAGELQFAGARAVRLAGSVVEFDPSHLVAGLDARVTGTFNLNGVLSPAPSGAASFGLADSHVLGRPLAGRGTLTLAPDQTLEVDATLGVRSATLTARGGLGAPGRTLALDLAAPELRDLGLPIAGRVTARARLAGAWTAPAIDAQLDAAAVRFGEHRIDQLQAVLTYAGGSDGALALQAGASNHRFRQQPVLSMQSATLRADGTLSDHRIELRASNGEAQPLALVIAGGWRAFEPKGRPEWRGELRTASAGKPLDLRLSAPAPIRTDFSRWAVGPLDFALAGARVEQLRIDVDRDVVSTSGRFSDLRPSELRGGAAAPLVRGARTHVPTTLRGQWQVRLGAQADGSLLIERSGGDILAGATPMGLSDLRLSAEVRANRLQAEARLIGEKAGRAEARLTAEVENGINGWALAPQRPWAATLDLDVPSIAWVNSLLTETVRANMRLGGAVKGGLRIDGTPAEPAAQGSFTGSALRVAWIEQGVRLENGRMTLRVEGNTIVLDELRFAGAPQVQPADRRAAQALAKDAPADPGFLAMSGQLQLRDLSGMLQVQAVRVPFLQRPDRWVVATGGANIVFDQKRVQLNGAVAANAGFVDFSRSNLPSLSNDVQVARAADGAAAREAPIGLALDLGIDLGPAFYLRGAGLDTQVEGQLRLRAEGRGAIRATGTLEARDGVFESFGQRLAIERGRVNFQGGLENPGLDVLAVRRGLPVEVGVAVTRTAQSPLIKLWSSTPMAEQDILSWLVLGRAAGDTEGGQDRVALAAAAASLLAGGGEGFGTQFARRLGIDELSLRTGEIAGGGSLLPRTSVAGTVRGGSTATEEIVTVGKRLSDNVSISYEQATKGADSVVQVVYRLTRQLSVLARAGTENAVNLVYTITFD